jgi:hypothetical protein
VGGRSVMWSASYLSHEVQGYFVLRSELERTAKEVDIHGNLKTVSFSVFQIICNNNNSNTVNPH